MSGRPAPPKPWERSQAAGATPPSPGEGLPKPWESPASTSGTTVIPASASGPASTTSTTTAGTPGQAPPRPWDTNNNTNSNLGTSYGVSPYGSSSLINRPGYGGYGSSMYGGYGSSMSSMYGGGGYGSSMYGAGAGMYGGVGMYGRPAGMYGGGMYGGGMYGTGMYGGGMGGGMYGGGGVPGMLGGPMQWDPNDPNGPPTPPTAWQAMMAGVGGIMHFFGRLSFLVDENAHAVHFFVTALLQLLDRFGSLYGELARFVLRLLGFRPKETANKDAIVPAGRGGGPPPQMHHRPGVNQGGPQWDGVWGRR